ncbi:MAG TPA: hemolysin III family protein [Anaerolineaceae bacterium]|nr:hemolysin III family protein [Anaerolineaceae bacterium]
MKIREPFSAISHFTGAAFALIGACLFFPWSGGAPAQEAALVVYALSLVGLFSASGIYHSVTAQPKVIEVLRKIDHSAIYVLIAGTYTPFCIISFTGFWHWGLLALIWTLALVGIVVKVFVINTPRWVTAGLYVIMGWLSIFAVQEFLLRLSPASFAWLLAGGILYTLGAGIYITKKGNFYPGVFGFHELWHIFVLLGAAAHFVAVTTIL